MIDQLPPAARWEWLKRKNEPEDRFNEYRYSPADYIENYFKWSPWSGSGQTGQQEIIDAYVLALRQQHERYDYLNNGLAESDLEYWTPGETIKSIISVDAGHSVGKTKLCSGLLNHFLDCFTPSIIYSFAPTSTQIKDLLWKEVIVDRGATDLPGRILKGDLKVDIAANHFAKGRATNNSHGTGTENTQGQHGNYLMFLIDEAEGVPKYVFDAIDSMASGGIAHIVLVARNPRTSGCEAHRIRKKKNVEALRISCLNHPNVITGRDVIPASVTRRWVDEKIDDWCTAVEEHDADKYTFEVNWRDEIYEPTDQRFLWRVLGIVGGQTADDVFCPLGRFEAAVDREAPEKVTSIEKISAQIGIDCARFGDDNGVGYCLTGGNVERFAQWVKMDTHQYYIDTKAHLKELSSNRVKHVSVRVDGGGGYGSAIIDSLKRDKDLKLWFETFVVHEVHFNGKPQDPSAYADMVSQMYASAAELTKGVSIIDPPEELETDFTQRKFKWVTKGKDREDVQGIESKSDFKKRVGRSPDDGDGYALAVATERTFIVEADNRNKPRVRKIPMAKRFQPKVYGTRRR